MSQQGIMWENSMALDWTQDHNSSAWVPGISGLFWEGTRPSDNGRYVARVRVYDSDIPYMGARAGVVYWAILDILGHADIRTLASGEAKTIDVARQTVEIALAKLRGEQ